ncbi:uncharacterized protein LOC135849382 [Planococcus citri]|uniref:uncharacterized protein LOC135849382 n=1 Tax=Planococcus citri TaxID=170843 RepID=UPI0031F7434D
MNTIISISVVFFSWKIHSNHANYTALNIVENANLSYEINTNVSTFKELLTQNKYFIDKTLLIKALINNHEYAIAITRPTKWGKSINLSMIRDFLKMEFDHKGAVYDRRGTANYRLFRRGELISENGDMIRLKYPLLINDDQEFLDKYQGNRPVIYLSFGNITWTNYEQFTKDFTMTVCDIFLEFHFLLNYMQIEMESGNKSTYDKGIVKDDIMDFRQYLFGKKNNYLELEQSLIFLCRMLHRYTGKKVYILIDEYDRPIIEILKHREFPFEERNFVNFFQFFICCAVDVDVNDHLAKGVLSGIYPVASRNYKTHSSVHGRLIEFYGLSPDDVYSLFTEYNATTRQSIWATSWYGGYKINDNEAHVSYNAYSVIQFLNTKRIENHWIKTRQDDFITKLIQCNPMIRNNIKRLIKNQKVIINIIDNKGLTETCVETLKLIINPPYSNDTSDKVKNAFFSYLLSMGYVTIVPKTYYKSELKIQIPNLEMVGEFIKRLNLFYVEEYHFDNKKLEIIINDLYVFMLSNETVSENLEISFEEFLQSFPSFEDVVIKNNASSNSSLGLTQEEFLRSIVDLIVIHMSHQIEKYGVDFMLQESDLEPDIAVYVHHLQRGIIIKIGFNETSPRTVFKKTKKYKPIFSKIDLQSIKFIGINILPDKTAHILALPLTLFVDYV